MENPPQSSNRFDRPSGFDRAVNRVFGFLVKIGLGLKHNYLIEVRGRKSGRLYSTPINVLELNGKRYLVAPRGRTDWVKNAVANNGATIVKGSRRQKVGLRPVADDARPEILKAYLDQFKTTVQRFFPIPAGSEASAFKPLAGQYPVFELIGDE